MNLEYLFRFGLNDEFIGNAFNYDDLVVSFARLGVGMGFVPPLYFRLLEELQLYGVVSILLTCDLNIDSLVLLDAGESNRIVIIQYFLAIKVVHSRVLQVSLHKYPA